MQPNSIFAQEGFEAARLEDIAAGAGYTRGAFYANFDSKEDIFFALFEEWVGERIESLTAALRRHSDPARKAGRPCEPTTPNWPQDRRLVLISMEFKLFALRHPEAHARLRSRHRRIRASFRRTVFGSAWARWAKRFRLPTRRPRPAWERSRRDCCWSI